MHSQALNRRCLLKSAAATIAPAVFLTHRETFADESTGPARSSLERPRFGLIGAGWRPDIRRAGRGIAIGRQASNIGDVVALGEVDDIAATFAKDRITGGKADVVRDYRDVLSRPDVDAVLIATPDHWHAKMSIEAMRAGKDVYCEKPATVTIAEGRQMADVAKETGRVLQVGTQQRTENDHRFAKAVAMIRDGRIGKVQRIQIGVEKGLDGGPFEKSAPPKTLDWDRWQGPAPEADYIKERTHWTFRWWYEYAGGKLTDWGAHHVDIAQWAIGQLGTGPASVEGQGTFLQPFKDGYPTRDDIYSMPVTFEVICRFTNVPGHGDIDVVVNDGDNGILFEGEGGRFFVNRGKMTGRPVEELASNPLADDAVEAVYRELPFGGPPPVSHMQHFVDSMRNRRTPISDIESHHRTITTCHLANLALRLGRRLEWDPAAERFVDDAEADTFLRRDYRAGYEIEPAQNSASVGSPPQPHNPAHSPQEVLA